MFPLLVLILLPVMSCINRAASQSHASENGFNNATSHCIDKERRALLAFKAGFVDDGGSLSSWSSEEGNEDCCNWSGVECSNGHVIRLDLYDFNLRGNISSSLLELRELNYLDFEWNDFEHRPIPNFFGSFTKLQYLDLSLSNLAGTIPFQLGNLSNLVHLHLEFNYALDGMIPQSFGNMRSLQSLYLSNCNLSGTIPYQLGNLSNLIHLDLHSNLLDGMIPQSFRNLYNLEDLYLSNCNLTGTILSQLGNLSNLVNLDLSSNLLDGMIPPSFGNLYNLQNLDLSNCKLTGTILSQLGNLSNLIHLDLSSNLLDGTIPRSFGNLCNLEFLHMSNNNLSGNLLFVDNFSSCAAASYYLISLDLSSNSLNGIVSDALLSNLQNLKYLDLSLNPLDFQIRPQWDPPFQLGSIRLRSCNLGPSFPHWIRTQKRFSYLDISNNGISDSIPSWFWDLSKVKYLNLSFNYIGGILPNLSSTFAPFPGIDLSSNNFEGPIPLLPHSLTSLNLSWNKFTGTLSFLCKIYGIVLTFLDISNNLLTGGFPRWGHAHCLTQPNRLVVLNLAHNILSGEIHPSSVEYLSSLETLYLYNNSFSGVLPESLSNCKQLTFLDVGMNKFTGIVPSWIGREKSHLRILSLRSNNFFGTIPANLCRLTTLQVLDLSINNLSGTIPPCLNNISAMVQKGLEVTDHKYAFGFNVMVNFSLTSLEIPKFKSYGLISYTDYSVIAWQGKELEFGNNLRLLKTIDLSRNNLTGGIPNEITELLELIALNLSRNALEGKVPQLIGRLKSLESLDLSRNMLSDKLPASLSDLNFLGYLDVSYNNFSGKIPSGTQLQGFNASYYIGNVGLCGPPLTSPCPGEEPPPPPLVVDNGDDNDEYVKWLYTGMAVGFGTGFWGICGALLLYRRGRHAFFLFVDDLKDWCHVKIAVKLSSINNF